jgi:hypothetical protein
VYEKIPVKTYQLSLMTGLFFWELMMGLFNYTQIISDFLFLFLKKILNQFTRELTIYQIEKYVEEL